MLAPGRATAQVAVPSLPETDKQTHQRNYDGGHHTTADDNDIEHFSCLKTLRFYQPHVLVSENKNWRRWLIVAC